MSHDSQVHLSRGLGAVHAKKTLEECPDLGAEFGTIRSPLVYSKSLDVIVMIK